MSEFELDESTDPKPGAALRQQLEEALAAKKSLEKELTSLKSQARATQVEQVLTAQGVNTKIAKFIPADVEGEEAVTTWLQENADVFGFTPQPIGNTSAASESPVSEQDVAASKRLQGLGQAAGTPSIAQDFEARIKAASTEAELATVLAEAQQYLL